MDQQNNNPGILYIMGAGRSGSTILNIILGAHPEIEAIGEAKHWAIFKGLPRDFEINSEDHCFWQNVLDGYERLEHGFPDFQKIEEIRSRVESQKISKFFRWETTDGITDAYNQHMSNLFSSIHKVSGKKFILDASKNIFRAHRLLKIPNLNVKVIHLIRDPRGIVWSFMKKNVDHKPKNPLNALFDYIVLNLASIYVRYAFRQSVIKVKYEDLTAQPGTVLKRIYDFIGVNDCGVAELIESGAELQVNHIIDGNRIRKNKSIKFKPDEEWKKNLPFHYKVLCLCTAWPVYLL